jgi:hypothetical protein
MHIYSNMLITFFTGYIMIITYSNN